MNQMAFPLHWPVGRARTKRYARKRNALWKGATVSTACHQIEVEVERMGGRDLVVSTNLALRLDGFPRSGQPEPDDVGVAVYFVRKGARIALACDRWMSVRENLRAVGMHLEAIRGQERWGVGTLDEAFAGYAALPDPDAPRGWWDALGLTEAMAKSLHVVEDKPTRMALLSEAYRKRAKDVHPDVGGTNEAFDALHKAYEVACRELGVA